MQLYPGDLLDMSGWKGVVAARHVVGAETRGFVGFPLCVSQMRELLPGVSQGPRGINIQAKGLLRALALGPAAAQLPDWKCVLVVSSQVSGKSLQEGTQSFCLDARSRGGLLRLLWVASTGAALGYVLCSLQAAADRWILVRGALAQ